MAIFIHYNAQFEDRLNCWLFTIQYIIKPNILFFRGIKSNNKTSQTITH
jgi:hypothetical protein